MRIRTLQRALREAGRIRIGYSTASENGQKIPHRLDRFRFTATDRATIEGVAARYGGEPEAWSEGGKAQWQVVTEADTLDVIYVAGLGLWQAHEQYAGGLLQVRCDGVRYMTPGQDGRLSDEGPCQCDPNERECATTTALSVILRDLPGVSTWRVVTHSYYAAVEMVATVDLIEMAVQAGTTVPARLFITQRSRRALIQGKPTTKRFDVLALDVSMSVAALGAGGVGGVSSLAGPADVLDATPADDAPPALPEAWQPVNQQALKPAPLVSVADQMADAARPVKRRANAAPPIPATGAQVRDAKAYEASLPNCSRCGEPYGTARLVANPAPGSRWIHADCLDDDDGPAEGAPPVDQPPPGAAEKPRGGGGTPGNAALRVVDPAPTTGTGPASAHIPMMTQPQHRKMMALSADIWPCEGRPSAEADAYRREQLLTLCAILGRPGLASRKEIDATTAPLLLDALEQLEGGRLILTDAGLVDRATGEVRAAAP